MKRTFTFLIAVLSFFTSFSTSITVSNSASGSWAVDTVFVEGNIVIPSSEQLVISPGTLVLFQSYFRIDVLGSLYALGNINDSIYFTVSDTANFHIQTQGRGGWSGIRFRQLNAEEDSSLFSYCRFEFAKATEDSINSYGGAVLVDSFNKVRISNCYFYNNYSYYSGGAVYLKMSDAIVMNCKFNSNYAGNSQGIVYGYGGGICSIAGSPVIHHCEFYANKSTGVGGGASFDGSNPVFSHNIMRGNYSGLGGALGVLRCAPQQTINNLLIADNEAAFFGGGICCIRSFPVFSNITLADNLSLYGGAFYCNDSAAPSMYNSIMWGNSGMGISVYIWDVHSAPNFYYCNIEGDTSEFEGSGAQLGYHGNYINNINHDPQFIGYGDYPFMLLDSSYCINAGTPDAAFLELPPNDIRGIDRIVDGCIDMGAYEFDGTTSSQQLTIDLNQLLVYPNPFTNHVSFLLSNTLKDNSPYRHVSDNDELALPTATRIIMIFNITGREINVLEVPDGVQIMHWDCRDVHGKEIPSGTYFIRLLTDKETFSCKLIKL